MLSSRELWKANFLSRCIEAGHTTPEEIHGVVKYALEKQALIDGIGSIIGLGALAAPPLVGYGLGRLGAKMTDIDDNEVEAIKKRELIDEYRQQTAQLMRDRQMQLYRQRRKAPKKSYFG